MYFQRAVRTLKANGMPAPPAQAEASDLEDGRLQIVRDLSELASYVDDPGGFLLSFPIMSWLAGKGEDKKSMPWLIASLVLGAVLNYIIGMCWFVFVAESNFAAAFTACVLPFIPTAIIKVLMAAFLGKELRSALVKAQVLKAA